MRARAYLTLLLQVQLYSTPLTRAHRALRVLRRALRTRRAHALGVEVADDGAAAEAVRDFVARIEELAARDDFHSEEGQRELRSLVEDAMRGVPGDASGQGRAQRRRVD